MCAVAVLPETSVPLSCLWRAPGSASLAQGPAGRELTLLLPGGTEQQEELSTGMARYR